MNIRSAWKWVYRSGGRRRKNRLSEAQMAVKRHLETAGHGYHCSSDYRDVINVLKGWGVLRTGIHVQ
jgi:hypothetical protein